MHEAGTGILCLITAVVSFAAFHDPTVKERFLFRPDRILARKEWHRLLTSALVHADWMHLAFNLMTLYSFGVAIEGFFGAEMLFVIYLASVLGGSLLSLWLHRFHTYSALGASGGVCGVMFTAIFIAPGISVQMIFPPISVPGPLFAAGYLIATFVALRRGNDNIGHDAHFGGAIVGLISALTLAPERCFASPWLFAGSVLFSALSLWVLAKDPFGIAGDFLSLSETKYNSSLRYQKYDEARARRQEQEEIDSILEKIASTGMESLSDKEREKLRRAASRNRG